MFTGCIEGLFKMFTFHKALETLPCR